MLRRLLCRLGWHEWHWFRQSGHDDGTPDPEGDRIARAFGVRKKKRCVHCDAPAHPWEP